MRKIVASSTDHIAMMDLSYCYQAINDAALNAVGRFREDVIGKNAWEIFNDSTAHTIDKQRLDRAFSGQVLKYRAWMTFAHLGQRYMNVVYTPYANANNQVAGCVVNSRDITERDELEKKLENAQKMEFMGTIAGGVAHDLNNILSGIVSYPELLLMQLPEDSVLIKPIKTIKKAGERAAVIVQDPLTLARRGVANKQPVDLNTIITQFLNSPECSNIQSFHPDVQIKIALTDRLKAISGSSVHLPKSVMNLVSNAAEAMPNSGEIIISTRNIDLVESINRDAGIRAGEYVLMEMKDEGMGISQVDVIKNF